jgi:transcription-repair coupling factor (superfamily II helicase)
MYRKLAQVTERAPLESLKGEMCDRFGALPASLELLLRVTELKLIASEKNVTVIETKDDRLMLTRNNDYITLGDKFPRLTKMNPKSRLNEIKKMLLAL